MRRDHGEWLASLTHHVVRCLCSRASVDWHRCRCRDHAKRKREVTMRRVILLSVVALGATGVAYVLRSKASKATA